MSYLKSLYRTSGKLIRYPITKGAWYFIVLPVKMSREIKLVDAGPHRAGFGSLRVAATIGETIWQTSIFPSSKDEAYLLPVKAEVRKKEGLKEGKLVRIQLEIRRNA
jgi:Domain of unknown function (DUF1905)